MRRHTPAVLLPGGPVGMGGLLSARDWAIFLSSDCNLRNLFRGFTSLLFTFYYDTAAVSRCCKFVLQNSYLIEIINHLRLLWNRRRVVGYLSNLYTTSISSLSLPFNPSLHLRGHQIKLVAVLVENCEGESKSWAKELAVGLTICKLK